MRLDQINSLVDEKIESLESVMRDELKSDIPVVSQMVQYIIESGGKRIRPRLLSLCAAACGYEGDKDVRYGAVYEFVHSATLIHDDIIDHAEVRRGKTALYRKFGTTLSILFGDLLYNTAMEMALRDDDLRIIRLICQATSRMIEGEIIQNKRNYNLEITLDDYLELIRDKTAYLFSACARTGAILAGAGEKLKNALADYGLNVGTAFQLVDDYLDYTSTQEYLGKPVFSDLKEGKITYPLLVLFTHTSEARDIVQKTFNKRQWPEKDIQRLQQLLAEHGVLEATLNSARDYASTAKKALAVLPPSDYSMALERLPTYVIERKK